MTGYKFSGFILFAVILLAAMPSQAQESRVSAVTVGKDATTSTIPKIRGDEKQEPKPKRVLSNDALSSKVAWKRIVYKELDLENDSNATLYYPEEPYGNGMNLFRIIMQNVLDGNIPAYEFLDGHEVFTTEFEIDIPTFLDKFYIPFETSTQYDRTSYIVNSLDLPSSEVLGYYMIEGWEFDNVENHTTAKVEALCPVLYRLGEIGEETLKYPLFWVYYDDLHPYLTRQPVFLNENDVTPRYTLADYFDLNMYRGEIYKTKNPRNKTLRQLYPDDDSRKKASDSIAVMLETFDSKLWVPSREEVFEARRAKEEKNKGLGSIPQRQESQSGKQVRSRTSRGSRPSGNQPPVTRSVRDRK